MTETKVKKNRTLFHKIVNVFLGVFIGIFILIVIFIGFSQTKTFRNLLRDNVIEIVNANINGKLYLEKIDGTILTSLILRNTLLTLDKDTILIAKKIELQTSPLRILLKQIHIRDFSIEDAKIELMKDSSGKYNISRLAKPTPKDTSKSEFPFSIRISDLNLRNVKFKSATYENKNSIKSYPFLNLDDFRVDSLYLSLNAFINISKKDFLLNIDGISCYTNLSNFSLRNLSGKFELTENYARVKNLAVKTRGTDFELDASLDNFHLFKNFTYAKLKTSPLKLKLTTRIFNFSELSSFVPATDLIKGIVTTTLYASGTYGNIKIDKIMLDYLNTHIEGTATLLDLHNPKNLFIKAHISNSYINQQDITKLLPSVQLHEFPDLKIKNIVADFEGKPTNFKASFSADLPQGNIKSDLKLDFTSDKIKYDVSLNTTGLNLSPIIKSSTNINLRAIIQGEGTNPQNLTSKIKINLSPSSYAKYSVDSLKLNTDAKDGIFDFKMETLADGGRFNLNGNIDFYDSKNPVYEIFGNLTNLNLEKILKNPAMNSNLNLSMELRGKSFDLDRMNSKLIVRIDSSKYTTINIHPTEFILSYTRPSADLQLIKLSSDFFDLNIKGNFSLKDAANVIGYEVETVSNLAKRKVNEINPYAFFRDLGKAKEFDLQLAKEEKIPDFVKNKFAMSYDLVIKDLSKIAALTNFKNFDLEGKIFGSIKNGDRQFEFSTNAIFNHLKMITNDNVVYVSNFNLSFNGSRENQVAATDNILGNLILTTERVFSGTDVNNFSLKLNLNKNVLGYDLSAQLDTTISAAVTGKVDFSNNNLKLSTDKFYLDYKKFIWENDGELKAFYNKDYFELQKFLLVRYGSSIDLSGKIFGNGLEEISAKVSNLDLEMINNLAELNPNTLSGKINLNAQLSGFLHQPIIKLQLNVDNIIAKGIKLGSLRAGFNYSQLLLTSDIKFLDTTFNQDNPSLAILGQIPINLAFVGAKERLLKDQAVQLSLKSKEFDLSGFGNFIPAVKDLGGKLFADLMIGGTLNDINLNGNMYLSNGAFTPLQNNLPYGLDMSLLFQGSSIILENFNLRNTGKTVFKGRMFGGGKINFNESTADMNIRGDLVVLSPESKSAMPYFYGDLTIKTDGDWLFTYKDGFSFFKGIVLLKNANITIPQTETSYSTGSDYVYRYVVDSSKIDEKQDEFKEVIALSKKHNPIKINRPKKSSNFGYDVRIRTEEEAILNLILNQEANQKLKAVLSGDLLFESGGIAQGEFKLLEGSELTFFKTFTAEGKIYFEREPTNPRLDIVATYQSERGDTAVAVKIRLEGPVDKLGENLSKSSKNIAVYETQTNIDRDIPSPDKSAADAIFFILTGEFVSGQTAGSKASISGLFNPNGYANSALSGILSSFANEYLGDVVRNIELEQRGSSQRLSVSGKIQKLKYSLGTKTEEFQDISKANLKLEYPFSDYFLIRFERKDPILENMNNSEKINEIAIKYKFVF
ncbi:MAG: hypothetical protein NTX22_01700 [Ignavibacteriales bacterium]|nr:hypothetical protein [Ignavibacteriales bacterium]